MAVVGDAYIVVRALTNRVRKDIEDGFKGVDNIGQQAGDDVGKSFSKGFNRGSGSSDKFKKFERDAEMARVKLARLIQIGYFVGPAIAGAAGAIGALGSGLFQLGAILGSATPALIVLPGLFLAAAQAAVAAKLAFSGVGAALQAGKKAQKDSADNSRQIEKAEKAVLKARIALRNVTRDASKRLIEAQNAAKDAADSAADSNLSAERSERSYKDSQDATRKAVDAVTKATEDAKEKRQQLRFEVEGGAISEKKARLEFEKARDSLQRVQDLPPNSRARREAELAFSEADLNLRRAIDKNKDLKKADQEATRVGVAGSEEVKAAVDSLNMARRNEGDALIDAVKAKRDAKKADEDAAKAAKDAQKGGTVDMSGIDAIADARDALKEAQKDLADLKNKPSAAAKAFNDAMKDLSPEARKFVKFILNEMNPAIKELKDAAGKKLFGQLETALRNLKNNLFPALKPLLEEAGNQLGGVAVKVSKALTSPTNKENLIEIFKSNNRVIKTLGGTVSKLIGGFLGLFRAAGPLIERFAKYTETVAAAFEKSTTGKENTEKLTETFNKAGDVAARIGKIFGSTFRGLNTAAKAVMEKGGGGDVILNFFQDAATKFEELMTKMSADGSLKKYFKDSAENATKVLELIGNIIGELLKLGDNEGVGEFTDSLSRAVDTFGRIGEKLTGPGGAASGLGEFIENFALLAENLTDSGSIEMFFKVLTGALKLVNKLFGAPGVKQVLGFIAVTFAVVRAFSLIFKVAKFGFLAISGSLLKVGAGMAKLGFKDPFQRFRNGSKTTRTELQKQMIVDKQKKAAMKGVSISADQAARSLGMTTAASKRVTPAMRIGAAATKVKSVALRGLGVAGRAAGVGLRAAGRGLALLGGPIGIILLLLPLIISNWDKIKAVIGKFITWLKENWPLVLAILTGPFGLIVLAVVKNWDKILEFFKGLPAKLAEFGSKLWGWILDAFKFVVDLYIKYWTTIFTFITGLPAKLLSLGGKIWNFVSDAIVTAWTAVSDFFTKTIFPYVIGIPGRFVQGVKNIWGFISDSISKAWDVVSGFFTNTIMPFITDLPARMIRGAGKIWGFVSDGISSAFTFIKTKFGEIVTFVTGLPAKIAKAASGLWNGIIGSFKSALNFIIGKWNSFSLNLRFPKSVFGIPLGPLAGKGFTLDTPDIPLLAQGGVVPATSGGMLAMIGEAGRPERIEPLDPDGLSKRDKALISMLSGGAGGPIINVYPSAGMDERELAEIVSRKLAFAMRRGAA